MASGVKDKSRETHLGVTGLCEECMPFSELHLNKLEKEAKKMQNNNGDTPLHIISNQYPSINIIQLLASELEGNIKRPVKSFFASQKKYLIIKLEKLFLKLENWI